MPITQDRIKVSVSSMPGPWATISGQEVEATTSKLRPGAGEPKQALRGLSVEFSDITVTRLFEPERDAKLLADLHTNPGAFDGTTVTELFLDTDGNAIPGAQVVHRGCVVASFSQPEGDANGTDAGYLSVTFSRSGAGK